MRANNVWPEEFDTKDIDGISDLQLCADGLLAWGNCSSGQGIHPNFGKVMAKISNRLGILGTGRSFQEKAEILLGKKLGSVGEMEK